MLQIGKRGPSVTVLAYDGMSGFELGIVTEVFGLPRPEFDRPWYCLLYTSWTRSPPAGP